MSLKGKSKLLPKNVSDKNEMNSLDINIQLLDKLRREEVIKAIMFFVIMILISACTFLRSY